MICKRFGMTLTVAAVICCGLSASAGSGAAPKGSAKKANTQNNAAEPAANTKLNGWEISLKENPMGRMTWYVSPNGAKMISPILSMVVNSPTGKVYLFSAETRRYAEYVDAGVIRKVIRNYDAPSQDRNKYSVWVKNGEEPYQGLHTITFTRKLLNPPVDRTRHLTSTYDEKMSVAPLPDVKAMTRFIAPIATIFASELPMPGIVVKRVTDWKVYKNGQFEKSEMQTELEMLSCKRVSLTASDFKVPADYEKRPSETDVLPDGMSFGLH